MTTQLSPATLSGKESYMALFKKLKSNVDKRQNVAFLTNSTSFEVNCIPEQGTATALYPISLCPSSPLDVNENLRFEGGGDLVPSDDGRSVGIN